MGQVVGNQDGVGYRTVAVYLVNKRDSYVVGETDKWINEALMLREAWPDCVVNHKLTTGKAKPRHRGFLLRWPDYFSSFSSQTPPMPSPQSVM